MEMVKAKRMEDTALYWQRMRVAVKTFFYLKTQSKMKGKLFT